MSPTGISRCGVPTRHVIAHPTRPSRWVPAILRIGAYRFFFYAIDRAEPVHVHVRHERNEAKFWLDPVTLERNRGFSAKELNRIERLVVEHEKELKEAWHDYFAA